MAKKQAKVQIVSTSQQSWLFKGIVFLGMLLMTIGIFGVILNNKDTNTFINFKYFFDTIKELKDATSSQASVYRSSSYSNIVIFFFAILITVIPTLVMFLRQKKYINVKKVFAFASVGSLVYLFATTIFWNVKVSFRGESNGYAFGWGAILIIVGFIIGLLGIILYELLERKSFISLRNIFAKAGLALMFFIALFGSLAACASNGTFTESFSIFTALLIEYKEVGAGVGMVAIIFSFASLVFFALTLYKMIYNNPNKKGNSIITFSALYFVTALISNVCIMSYLTQVASAEGGTGITISLASGAIVQIVLGLGVVVAAILTRIFRRTDREVA